MDEKPGDNALESKTEATAKHNVIVIEPQCKTEPVPLNDYEPCDHLITKQEPGVDDFIYKDTCHIKMEFEENPVCSKVILSTTTSPSDIKLTSAECNGKEWTPVREELKTHQSKIDNVGLKPFKRDQHAEMFSLETDRIILTGLKSYKNYQGGKCFTENRYLSKHRLTDTGTKSYQSGKCRKLSIKKGSLTRHKLNLTELKPYKCDECGKCFAQKGTLSRHQLIHKGLKPYKCEECGKCFSKNATLLHTSQYTQD